MQNIPFFSSYEPKTKQLILRGATHFSREIFDFADEIEILDVSHGTLSSLPNDFARLHKLKIAFFSNNLFTSVPEVLSECVGLSMVGFKSCKISNFAENALPASIRWLILTGNCLEKLPASMGKLIQLQKLSLTGNRLKSLPDEMVACNRLELLRLSANNFSAEPPAWLFTLPRLTWYGDNGNPFSHNNSATQSSLQDISWEEIEFNEKIGESPSSRVFRGVLKKSQQEVAVKVFKGGLTSDGFPADDMRASLAAGTHENLIKILGKLLPNSDQQEGLVLSLVPPTYKRLGLPPDFETCSRDTYPANTVFSLPYILNVLKGIASACQHLHERGLAHGDIYAHNILTNSAGHSLLGDFGAASFYDPLSGRVREQLDVRAFGCLVEDLLDHVETGSDKKMVAKLRGLQKACLNENIADRPVFREVCGMI